MLTASVLSKRMKPVKRRFETWDHVWGENEVPICLNPKPQKQLKTASKGVRKSFPSVKNTMVFIANF